jgi:hypothetical protein
MAIWSQAHRCIIHQNERYLMVSGLVKQPPWSYLRLWPGTLRMYIPWIVEFDFEVQMAMQPSVPTRGV